MKEKEAAVDAGVVIIARKRPANQRRAIDTPPAKAPQAVASKDLESGTDEPVAGSAKTSSVAAEMAALQALCTGKKLAPPAEQEPAEEAPASIHTCKGPSSSSKEAPAAVRLGPKRAAAETVSTCRFDYAPDICKDYNETGFCGFGDSCKFLHDRGDYKAGWQMDNEWEASLGRAEGAQRAASDPNEFLILADDAVQAPSGVPESASNICTICKKELTAPIVMTRCRHKFCQACALGRSRTSPRCATCKTRIDGQFTVVS